MSKSLLWTKRPDETSYNLRAYLDRMPDEQMRQYRDDWSDDKSWVGHASALNIQKNVKQFLLNAARQKVSGKYAKLRATHADVTTAAGPGWRADDYRNEFMFARILEAAATGNLWCSRALGIRICAH